MKKKTNSKITLCKKQSAWMFSGVTLAALDANRKLPKDLVQKFVKIGNQSEIEDPVFLAKFFHPFLPWEFFCASYNKERNCFFGLARSSICEEWGLLSLNAEDLEILGMQRIEREIYFQATRFSELKPSGFRPVESRSLK